ncbi:MAG: TrkH family potassium uptake protein [Pseudomonadota bacterium]
MQLLVVQRILGILFMMHSVTMLPPVLVALAYGEREWADFLITFGILFIFGVAVWWPVRDERRELRTRDGFVIVVMFWTVLGMAGAIPFMLDLDLPFTDAVFESVSGFTTTGATVLSGLDHLPKAILYYRQQLTFIGGIGIVVLAVAILPMLGVGGMSLYRAETPGPMKDTKLTPRIIETARAFSYTYLGLCAACALAFWAAGMDLFDAVGHSFAVLATAGFSNHDASFAYFDSPLIEAIACVFMLLGAISFSAHFLAWRGFHMRYYWQDRELRAFLWVTFLLIILFTLMLAWTSQYSDFWQALRYAAFNVISTLTTTGYVTANFSEWPSFLPVLLMLIAFIGGCAGSTAGGLKMMRVMLLYKQGMREIWRLAHPRGIFPIKVGGKSLPNNVVDAIWGFFSFYMLSALVLTLVMMGTGLDAVTAFSAVSASLNNMGAGLNELGSTFEPVTTFGKWVLIFAMLLGRLEIFALLVLFTPAFWRR